MWLGVAGILLYIAGDEVTDDAGDVTADGDEVTTTVATVVDNVA